VWSGRNLPTFQRSLLPPSSEYRHLHLISSSGPGLSLVSFECGNLFLTLREEHGLAVFENRMGISAEKNMGT
jgi:hypothetical protein